MSKRREMKLSPIASFRQLMAIVWAIELARAIHFFPIGHINAHKWPYSPYTIRNGKERRPGHKL
jgi:hypothetical protein